MNDNVIILQDKLKQLGYYNQSITGSYDTYTKNALNKMQQDYALPVTDEISTELWTLLNTDNNVKSANFSITSERPTLRLGSTGIYVTELQTLLTDLLYYNGQIDGNFGTSTESAVKSFQFNNKLTPDGIVGKDTWSALTSLYSPLTICEEDNNSSNSNITYTVVRGDSLWSIARKYNTTVNAIKQLNNLTSNTIYIGQKLQIPVSNNTGNNITYTVVRGDSLWSIAREYNTTVDAIKQLNNLTSNTIYIGQKLQIPVSNNTGNNLTYTVVKGDSLWSIARKYNTTVDAIKQLNNLTSNVITVGQTLQIPV